MLKENDNVIAWLYKNASESIFNDDRTIDWKYTYLMTIDNLETLTNTYIEKYNEVISNDEIEVYRLIKLNTIKFKFKNVGVFWSFDENGVGAYGVGKKFTGNNTFILNAIIKTNDIDWEQGFYSFLLYGK